MEYKDVYEAISKYYYIEENINAEGDDSYSAARRIPTEMIDNKLHKNIVQWQQIVKEIQITFPNLLSVYHGNDHVDTCYTIVLFIAKKEIENVTFTQELFCHFSLLADFFCIYGKDSIQLIDKGLKSDFDPIITISPKNIYEEYFSKLLLMIKKTMPHYRFLAFVFLKQRIVGLRIFSTFLKDNQYSSVYQALFTPENLTDYKKRGNILFE